MNAKTPAPEPYRSGPQLRDASMSDEALRELRNRFLPALYARTSLDGLSIDVALDALLPLVEAYGDRREAAGAERALRDAADEADRRWQALDYEPGYIEGRRDGLDEMEQWLLARADELHGG